MANKGVGIDLRATEALLLEGKRKGAAFQITDFQTLPREGTRLQAGEEPIGRVVASMTGRDLILKYTRVPTVPDWQLQQLMDFEVQEISSQAGGSLSADYNLLPVADELTGEDTVLLALAKNEAICELTALIEEAKGSAEAFTPNAIAIYNAYLMLGPVSEEETTLLAWLGESTVDLALVRGTNLLFARNVSGGLGVLDGAIAQTFNVREQRARKIRREILNLDPAKRGSYGSSQEEKVAHSVAGVAGQLQAALRSTLAFCQSQTNIQDLELDKVLLCGPGAKVKGMDRYLAGGSSATVQVWDPAPDLDLSQCPAESSSALSEAGPELVVALGLAMAPCFDDLYSIEILPEAVKRKRRFMSRTIFNIAAGVLALLYLLVHMLTAKSSYAELSVQARKLRSTLRRIERTDREARKLIEENKKKAAELGKLVELGVPMHGSIRVVRALRRNLPEDLWITKIFTDRGPPLRASGVMTPGRGQRLAERPMVRYEGRGLPVSGQDLDSTYSMFQTKMQKDPDVPMLNPSTDSRAEFKFFGTVDYLFQEDKLLQEDKGGN